MDSEVFGGRTPPSALRIALSLTVIVLALALRLIGLSRYGLDGDEVFSVEAAGASWPDLFSTAASDISHPPLYYFILKLWLMLGPIDETWVRGLSAVVGIGSLFFANKICGLLRISAADTALVLFLMAVNGVLIYYAQHARMFALLQLTSTGQLYVFLLYVRKPATVAPIAGLVAANLLLVYTHYWGWIFLTAEFTALLWLDRSKLITFAVAGFSTLVGFTPWPWAVFHEVAQLGTGTAQIKWMGIGAPGIAEYIRLIASLNGTIDFLHSTVLGLLIFATPIGTFCWLSSQELLSDPIKSATPWIILVSVPMLLTSAASYLLKQNLWGDRHMQIIAVPYYLLLGLSLSRLRSRDLALIARVVIIAWAAWAGARSVTDMHQKFDWRLIATHVTSDADTPIIASEAYVALPLGFQVARLMPSSHVNEAEISTISADRFWFVYRDRTGQQADHPEKLFEERGYSIGQEISTTTGPHTVTAIFVHR